MYMYINICIYKICVYMIYLRICAFIYTYILYIYMYVCIYIHFYLVCWSIVASYLVSQCMFSHALHDQVFNLRYRSFSYL